MVCLCTDEAAWEADVNWQQQRPFLTEELLLYGRDLQGLQIFGSPDCTHEFSDYLGHLF